MELTVYNFAKFRLETINIKFTNDNTIWIEDLEENSGIYYLTDCEYGLLVKEDNYKYPYIIPDAKRKDVQGKIEKVMELVHQYV